jgi:ABC-2 type transport system permease protein
MKRLRVELRLLFADRASLFIALFFLIAALGALWNGWQWQRARAAAVQAERQRGDDEVQTVRRELAAIAAGRLQLADASLPTRFVGRFQHRALLPPAMLSMTAIGLAESQPFAAQVSLFSVKHSLLEKHQFEDPLASYAGRFDLAFVIVYLLPLVVLAFAYDILSAERERGTLALAILQSGSMSRVLRAKLAARVLVVVAMIAVPLTALAFVAPPMHVALWGIVVFAYAAFWCALSVAVNLRSRSSSANATFLAAIWIVLLLVVPAALNLFATKAHPLPSRITELANIRAVNLATAESGERLLNQFLQEHPDLAAERADNGASQYFAIRQAQERSIAPFVQAFDEQLARQQRLISRYRILSPAIVADELLLEIAGTGPARFASYRAQLDRFLDRWRSYFVLRAFRGGLLTAHELGGMPRFAFTEEPVTPLLRRTAGGVLLLVLPVAMLMIFITARLRRIEH